MTLDPLSSRIRDAYSSSRFAEQGHRLIDAVAGYLQRTTGRDDAKVVPPLDPVAARARWRTEEFAGGEDPVALLAAVAEGSTRLHHPRCLGHQVAPPLPVAALADLMAALLNNGMAVFEMGPVSSPMELGLVDWMNRLIGWPGTAGGLLTSGGSLGNLTALLAARQARAGFDIWRAGTQGGPPLAVLCSELSHYSVSRALRIMGLGDDGAIAVPVDSRYRMTAEALAGAADAAANRGRRIFAVVASAGATATGSYDPLAELGAVCTERGYWLHVDGAHGASALLSRTHRHLLDGIAAADSVVWDAHKLLMMPGIVTAVLYRDGARARQAFAQDASYLFADGAEQPWWDLGGGTLECTKRMMSVILYASLASHGEALFAEVIDRLFALGRAFADKIAAVPDLELALAPEANIVCFRVRRPGASPAELDRLQQEVRRRIVADGDYYLVATRLAGSWWLRVSIMNPLIEEQDLDGLLARIAATAAQVAGGP